MISWSIGDTTKQLQDKLVDLQVAMDEIKAELERRANLGDDHKLAEELHRLQCRWNHEDGCGWYYEFNHQTKQPKWDIGSHMQYLQKARKLLSEVSNDPAEVIRIVEAIK